ncbi:uncharacterized protein LTR77_008363 [Saxophila tyrrhenica]|uniref:Uncharacterized protein n=1 Tax=Saxophila tyrrhenica TaxID=1690608 RepID=A0AAV9P0P3_9PEZI|nr:hypothetical protein LTR77_008363 [Saxophila tyrrhenica]
MADTKPDLPKRPTTYSSARSPPATATQRVAQRQTSSQTLNGSLSPAPTLDRRRSSLLSYTSIDTLAPDIINPTTSRPGTAQDDQEVTHWHSTPLAFAILPAVAGLLFKNGSAFATDALLLGLAAVFMNWSIRLPWDWYYSAQVQRRVAGWEDTDGLDGAEADETAVETESSESNSPKDQPDVQTDADQDTTSSPPSKEAAASELRRQELLALLSTFAFPVMAAYLIHVIRAQLSTPSTGLVSDFNLAIFLLAAEIRPCRQLVRLITARTWHLQRTVTGLNDPFSGGLESKSTIETLLSRVSDLEAKLSDHTVVPQTTSLAQKHDVSDLSTELRKRYEPRLESLERAMRRYEKRAATMAMQVEQRFGTLEGNMQDTLSLAAQAARQSQNRGVLAKMLETVSVVVALPMKVMWGVVIWPVTVVEEAYAKMKAILVGPPAVKVKKVDGGRRAVGKDDAHTLLMRSKTRLRLPGKSKVELRCSFRVDMGRKWILGPQVQLSDTSTHGEQYHQPHAPTSALHAMATPPTMAVTGPAATAVPEWLGMPIRYAIETFLRYTTSNVPTTDRTVCINLSRTSFNLTLFSITIRMYLGIRREAGRNAHRKTLMLAYISVAISGALSWFLINMQYALVTLQLPEGMEWGGVGVTFNHRIVVMVGVVWESYKYYKTDEGEMEPLGGERERKEVEGKDC